MEYINKKIGVLPNIQKYQPRIFEKVPDLVPGTSLHDEYWEQERLRCMEGFKPKGMTRITGPHYFFLNYFPMKINDPTADAKNDRKVLGLPFFRDMDYLYFKTVEECKQDREGLIVAKARDKGFSMFNSCLIEHEFNFYPHNEVGVAAGLEDTIVSFANKVRLAHSNLPDEFRNNILKDNDDIIYSGYEWNNKGRWDKDGLLSMIHLRTMGLNPNVFKGERLSMMIFEEAGEFRKLIEGFRASEPCFRRGSEQFGVPIVGGTGGNILNASADFKTMWYTHEDFNLRQLFIPVTMCYQGFFDFTTGKSDIAAARKHEEERRAKLEQGDQHSFNLHVQNYPFDPEESFMKSGRSPFNISKINNQRKKILSNKYHEYRLEEGDFEWLDDELTKKDGDTRQFNKRVFGSKVKFVKKKGGPVKILEHPMMDPNDPEKHKYWNLDIGGVDSFDQDDVGASDSEGAAIIYRRFVNLDTPYNFPIATLKFRSNRAEEFYEKVLQMAIYYNSKMLIEYTKIGIIEYFQRNGAQRYMKEKPHSVHTAGTTTRNKFGVHMNKQIKELGIELMADEIDKHVHDNWFIDLLDEFVDFGERNTDLAMAYMMCQIHNFDISKVRVIKEEEVLEADPYSWGEWVPDMEGNMVNLQTPVKQAGTNSDMRYNEIRRIRQIQNG